MSTDPYAIPERPPLAIPLKGYLVKETAEQVWVQDNQGTWIVNAKPRNKPADAVFFFVWRADRAGVDRAVAAAQAAGKIGDDDIVIAEVWPKHRTTRRKSSSG